MGHETTLVATIAVGLGVALLFGFAAVGFVVRGDRELALSMFGQGS